jgi:hypothetical protein
MQFPSHPDHRLVILPAETSQPLIKPLFYLLMSFTHYSFALQSFVLLGRLLLHSTDCRFNLRLMFNGLLNLVTQLFSCPVNWLWYMIECLFISSVTNGIWRSLCSVRLEIYHGLADLCSHQLNWSKEILFWLRQ